MKLRKTIISIPVFIGILLFIVASRDLHAQVKNSFFGINTGASFPIGDFKSTELNTGSFAITGLTVNMEGAWFFLPYLGVGASAGFNLNPLDVGALEWETYNIDPFLNDISIRSEPFFTVTAMAGAYTICPVYKKVSVTGKLLGGLLFGNTPYQLYKPEYFLFGPPFYEKTSAQDWKFSFQAGAGIHYDVSGCIGLIAEATILYDKLNFNFNTSQGIRTDVRTIAMINTTIGFRIKI
jgi:opacity protein-like surface antigen